MPIAERVALSADQWKADDDIVFSHKSKKKKIKKKKLKGLRLICILNFSEISFKCFALFNKSHFSMEVTVVEITSSKHLTAYF